MNGKPVQRLRVTFTRGEAIKYISHLDLMRLWERALRRADAPMAYSQGFSPRPRLSLAAPLPVGVTSEGELLELYLQEAMPPPQFHQLLAQTLPPAVGILGVEEVPLQEPSLPSRLRAAAYLVGVAKENKSPEGVRAAIKALLAAPTLPRERAKEGRKHCYDLRPLILELWLAGITREQFHLGMVLRMGQGAGRPEEVTLALGFSEYPLSIHRRRLIFEG